MACENAENASNEYRDVIKNSINCASCGKMYRIFKVSDRMQPNESVAKKNFFFYNNRKEK